MHIVSAVYIETMVDGGSGVRGKMIQTLEKATAEMERMILDLHRLKREKLDFLTTKSEGGPIVNRCLMKDLRDPLTDKELAETEVYSIDFDNIQAAATAQYLGDCFPEGDKTKHLYDYLVVSKAGGEELVYDRGQLERLLLCPVDDCVGTFLLGCRLSSCADIKDILEMMVGVECCPVWKYVSKAPDLPWPWPELAERSDLIVACYRQLMKYLSKERGALSRNKSADIWKILRSDPDAHMKQSEATSDQSDIYNWRKLAANKHMGVDDYVTFYDNLTSHRKEISVDLPAYLDIVLFDLKRSSAEIGVPNEDSALSKGGSDVAIKPKGYSIGVNTDGGAGAKGRTETSPDWEWGKILSHEKLNVSYLEAIKARKRDKPTLQTVMDCLSKNKGLGIWEIVARSEILEDWADTKGQHEVVWDWNELSCNPCLNISLFRTYKDDLKYDRLSTNKTTHIWELVGDSSDDPRWLWEKLALNENLNIDSFDRHQDKLSPWADTMSANKAKDIWRIVDKIPNECWNWTKLSRSEYITPAIFIKYGALMKVDKLSENMGMGIARIFEAHPELPWKLDTLCKNRCLTLALVLKTRNKSWNMSVLGFNGVIPVPFSIKALRKQSMELRRQGVRMSAHGNQPLPTGNIGSIRESQVASSSSSRDKGKGRYQSPEQQLDPRQNSDENPLDRTPEGSVPELDRRAGPSPGSGKNLKRTQAQQNTATGVASSSSSRDKGKGRYQSPEQQLDPRQNSDEHPLDRTPEGSVPELDRSAGPSPGSGKELKRIQARHSKTASEFENDFNSWGWTVQDELAKPLDLQAMDTEADKTTALLNFIDWESDIAQTTLKSQPPNHAGRIASLVIGHDTSTDTLVREILMQRDIPFTYEKRHDDAIFTLTFKPRDVNFTTMTPDDIKRSLERRRLIADKERRACVVSIIVGSANIRYVIERILSTYNNISFRDSITDDNVIELTINPSAYLDFTTIDLETAKIRLKILMRNEIDIADKVERARVATIIVGQNAHNPDGAANIRSEVEQILSTCDNIAFRDSSDNAAIDITIYPRRLNLIAVDTDAVIPSLRTFLENESIADEMTRARVATIIIGQDTQKRTTIEKMLSMYDNITFKDDATDDAAIEITINPLVNF